MQQNLSKKISRLDPVVDERQTRFDEESNKLLAVRRKKIKTISEMKQKQREYMHGVTRLNNERTSANRLMLEALEGGLDTVKQQWMDLYQAVLVCEREEVAQTEVMSKAHRDLEAIKHLQAKYRVEQSKDLARRDQKQQDEIALRRFVNG